jgi:hypothetical protein
MTYFFLCWNPLLAGLVVDGLAVDGLLEDYGFLFP